MPDAADMERSPAGQAGAPPLTIVIPAFNVADSLVCVGTAILVWVIIRDEKTADASNPV